MISYASLQRLENNLSKALDNTGVCVDELTGRDTYPIVDDKIHDTFEFYFACELERIRGGLIHLHDQTVQNREFHPDSFDRTKL